MTSYERVMKTLHHEEPDRVPIAELVISPGVYKKLLPNASTIGDFYDAYDYDVVMAIAAYEKVSQSPDGGYTDEWGITYKTTDNGDTYHPVFHPLKDVTEVGDFYPPSSDSPVRLGLLPQYVEKYKGKKAIAFLLRAGFLWASALVSMDDLLCKFYEDEDFVNELFDRIFNEQTNLARKAVRAGADIIFDTDDFAYNSGPLFSPKMFEKYISPRLKRLVDAVHEEGALLIKHTDGNVEKLLDVFIACGIDGLHSLDPQAGMDIAKIKKQYGDRIALWGNIDCGNLMCCGSPEEIDAAVKECIKNAAPGGGYVLTSSNSLTAMTKPENLLAMINALKKYGTYPII